MLVSINTTSPHEELKELEIQLHKYLVCLEFWDNCCTNVPRIKNMPLTILYSDIINKILFLKWVLPICKICQFIIIQENMNFQFVPFFSTGTQAFLCTIFRVPQKNVWYMTETCTKFSRYEFGSNLYQAFYL